MWKPLVLPGYFILWLSTALAIHATGATTLKFEVAIAKDLAVAPQTGRMIVILGQKEKPEPRFTLGRTGADAPFMLARDVNGLAPGIPATLGQNVITCPITNLADLPKGDYFVQALLDSNRDLRSPDAPGNLYSDVQEIHLDPAHGRAIKLELARQIPAEQLPADTEGVKFVKIKSQLLSQFHGRPIYLRAGVILPRDYDREPTRKYPLWVRIGGSRTRFSSVSSLMGEN